MLLRSVWCDYQNFVDLPVRKFIVRRLIFPLLGELVEFGGHLRHLLVKLKVQLLALILLGILLAC